MRILNILPLANQWLSETPERALDQAYRAALKIKDIENKHFNSQKVSLENAQYSPRVIAYFQSEIRNYLRIIRFKITEFNLSRNILNITNFSSRRYRRGSEIVVISDIQSSLIVDKLEVIESVTSKYLAGASHSHLKIEKKPIIESMNNSRLPQGKGNQKIKATGQPSEPNVVPRSFFSTLNRLKKEIDPESAGTEEEMIKQFRESRYQTGISIRFLLILFITPLVVYQLSKTFVVIPVLNNYFESKDKITFLNQDLEREAMQELREYQELLEFKALMSGSPSIEPEKKEEQLKEKVQEISISYKKSSISAIANIFADSLAFISIIIVFSLNRREVDVVKSFLNNMFYNLSDSAKAFILILFTDMFVGFHSPHGWEVIIGTVTRHLGLPENQDFSNIFIATFPVILDTIFKYWIFRYLNGLSPSSVATYKNMNE